MHRSDFYCSVPISGDLTAHELRTLKPTLQSLLAAVEAESGREVLDLCTKELQRRFHGSLSFFLLRYVCAQDACQITNWVWTVLIPENFPLATSDILSLPAVAFSAGSMIVLTSGHDGHLVV